MGTKRPSPSVCGAPHKKQSLEKQSDCSDCPICLESCHDENQCFTLDCCNRSLANDSVPQRCHKTCVFSHIRHTIETEVQKGRSLMFMADGELSHIVKCPRCREYIPLTRTYCNANGHLGCNIRFQGWPFAEACIFAKKYQTREDSVFYATVVGKINNPEECVKNRECFSVKQYNRLPSGKIENGVFTTPLEDIPSPIRVLGLAFKT